MVTGATDPRLASWAAAHARSAGRGLAEAREPLVTPRPGEPVTVEMRTLHVLDGHTERFQAEMVWTDMPDGRRLLVSASVDGTARTWDGRTGLPIHAFTHRSGAPGSEPETVDPADPNPFATLTRHCIYAVDTFVAPDTGRLCVVSVGLDEWVNIWDAEADVLLNSFDCGMGRILGVACVWNGDDLSVVTVGDAGAQSWNPFTGERQYASSYGRDLYSLGRLRLPDGTELLAVGDGVGQVHILDGHTGGVRRVLNVKSSDSGSRDLVTSSNLVLSEHGTALVAVTQNTGRVSVWDVHSGELVMNLEGHEDSASSVSWVTLPDGRLLLASSGRDNTVRIWDPAAGVCVMTLRTPDEVGGVTWARPERDNVMLAGGCGDAHGYVWEVRWSPVLAAADGESTGGGRPVAGASEGSGVVGLTATPVSSGRGRTQAVGWRVTNDDPVPHVLTVRRSGEVEAAAVAVSSDGTERQVFGEHGGLVMLKPSEAGGSVGRTQPLHAGGYRCVAFAETPEGRLLVAADVGRTGVVVVDVTHEFARGVRTFSTVPMTVTAVALGALPDGRNLVAAAHAGVGVDIWDTTVPAPLAQLNTATTSRGMAFARTPYGRTVFAVGQDYGLTLYETEDGLTVNLAAGLRGYLPTGAQVRTVSWLTLPDGRMLLAAGLINGQVCVWDFPDLHGPFVVDTHCGWLASVSLTVDPAGNAWLAAGGGRGWSTHLLSLDPPVGEGFLRAARSRAVPVAVRSAAMPGLFALGQAGMWRPLGVLEDALTLTGAARQGALHDSRLAVLREHTGVRRLRELNWPARARVALGGLLLVDADCGDAWAPPEGTGPAQWKAAFGGLPPVAPGAEPTAVPTVEELTAAADRIGERTVAMLTILGPDTAAADPGLVLRLIGREQDLPPLGDQGLRLLTAASLEQSRVTSRVGVATHVPGAVGVSRHGLPGQLLQTQLALPEKVLKLRRLTDELLYRQHSAFVPPRLRPVTIVLDTTPPTFGGAENLLRLVGHLVTMALWRQGEHPRLVTTGRPDRAVELTGAAQLMDLWTSRTLRAPDETLPAALDTARADHLPVVLLAHQYAPRPEPAPWLRLLTTYQPGERPVPGPLNGHHVLPPDPPVGQLMSTVRALLADGERGTGR